MLKNGVFERALTNNSLRDLFNIHPIRMSVGIWIGFLALFGIASDDGVVMATYIKQLSHGKTSTSKQEIHDLVVKGGKRRVRPCLMTTAVTILALIPILTSKGVGSDIMIPMVLPIFGGLLLNFRIYEILVISLIIKELALTYRYAIVVFNITMKLVFECPTEEHGMSNRVSAKLEERRLMMKEKKFDLQDRLIDYAVRIMKMSEKLPNTKKQIS